MTLSQLDLLVGAHVRAHQSLSKNGRAAQQGTVGDLLELRQMAG